MHSPGSVLQSIAYIMQIPEPVFPVFAVAFFFAGFGLSLQVSRHQLSVAELLGLISSLQNAGSSSFVGVLKNP